MKIHLPAILLAALLAGACTSAGPGSPNASGGPSRPGTSGQPGGGAAASPLPASSPELVLRVSTDGGFVAPGQILTRIPEFSLFADGRVITVGPQIAIYPGPALPNLLVQRVSAAGMQRILGAARDAGLYGADRQLDFPGIMDAPWTTFTLVEGGTRHVTRAYALGAEGGPAVGGPAATAGIGDAAVARQALIELRAKLGDLGSWLGADVVEPDRAFAFAALRVYVDPAAPAASAPASALPGEPQPVTVAWPGSTPLEALGAPVPGLTATRCAVLEGAELARVLPALGAANALTRWESGGRSWMLRLRPLLPDESGCVGPAPQG